MTRDAGFKQRVRARMRKTGETYTAARAHLDRGAARASESGPDSGSTLHVTNGESAAVSLRAAGLGGEVLSWRDVLHEGPVPAGLSAAQLRQVRAAYVAREGFAQFAEVAASFAARDDELEAHVGHQYVLWFEADLYDQLQLIQVISRLRELGVEPRTVTLVSIGEYPGIAHFGGLGELAPEALAGLRPTGLPLGVETFRMAGQAWGAFTAAAPRDVPSMVRLTSPELRFLGEALARLMQEYPSRLDGLSLTERRILLAIDEGPRTVGRTFGAVRARERRPYLGDVTFFAIVRRLATAAHPLLLIDDHPGKDFSTTGLRLTGAGRDVLSGVADHARLNGIDRWIGGVHLTGTEPAWRYDERLETLVQAT